jgi:hypothetical protein
LQRFADFILPNPEKLGLDLVPQPGVDVSLDSIEAHPDNLTLDRISRVEFKPVADSNDNARVLHPAVIFRWIDTFRNVLDLSASVREGIRQGDVVDELHTPKLLEVLRVVRIFLTAALLFEKDNWRLWQTSLQLRSHTVCKDGANRAELESDSVRECELRPIRPQLPYYCLGDNIRGF